MNVLDYNGEGRWSRKEVLARYDQYADELRVTRRDLTPQEHVAGDTRWFYPVMDKVIEGIEAGDPACVRLGIEFIEEDAKMPFGKILKSNTARALRRAELSEPQKRRIRRRVFGMLRAGKVPHEFREYAKLVRRVGFDPRELPELAPKSARLKRFVAYFETATGERTETR